MDMEKYRHVSALCEEATKKQNEASEKISSNERKRLRAQVLISALTNLTEKKDLNTDEWREVYDVIYGEILKCHGKKQSRAKDFGVLGTVVVEDILAGRLTSVKKGVEVLVEIACCDDKTAKSFIEDQINFLSRYK